MHLLYVRRTTRSIAHKKCQAVFMKIGCNLTWYGLLVSFRMKCVVDLHTIIMPTNHKCIGETALV